MTVQGRVHRWSATPCQDAVAGAKHKGVTALALCDGAGSLPLSHAGASRLSEVFARWVSARFYALLQQSDRAVAEEGAALIERTLAELASQYRAAPEAFGSTLLLVACDRYGKNLCMHLGDGLIVGMTNSGRQVLVSEPDGVRNATYLPQLPGTEGASESMPAGEYCRLLPQQRRLPKNPLRSGRRRRFRIAGDFAASG